MAAIIDSTGNLDVLRIYAIILSRLQNDPELRQSQGLIDGPTDLSVEELAAKILDRVKIMRVFDLVGVMEAIGEIRQELEGRSRKPQSQEKTEENSRDTEVQEKPKSVQKTVIADSEDEEDDDMLFDSPKSITKQSSAAPVADTATLPDAEPKPPEKARAETEGKISFVLIDNLAHVISPLLKKDYIQGMWFVTNMIFHIMLE